VQLPSQSELLVRCDNLASKNSGFIAEIFFFNLFQDLAFNSTTSYHGCVNERPKAKTLSESA
jgi:hypothetical protein